MSIFKNGFVNFYTLIILIFFLRVSDKVYSQENNLTNITVIEYAYPFWSPEGDRIIFQSNIYGSWDIFIMNPDGSDRKRLTKDPYNNITPAFSPDGNKIAYVSDRDNDNDIYIMNVEGEILDKITHNDFRDYHPTWSPEGNKITFGSGATEKETEIYEIDLTSRKITRITDNDHFDSFSNYSPDGSSIVFIKWLPENNGELFTINLKSGEEKRLTNTSIFEGYPVWSHDGQYVYYAFPNQTSRKYDINKVNVNTLEVQKVFESLKHDARPRESNDGTKLVFNREDENGMDIFIMELNK